MCIENCKQIKIKSLLFLRHQSKQRKLCRITKHLGIILLFLTSILLKLPNFTSNLNPNPIPFNSKVKHDSFIIKGHKTLCCILKLLILGFREAMIMVENLISDCRTLTTLVYVAIYILLINNIIYGINSVILVILHSIL